MDTPVAPTNPNAALARHAVAYAMSQGVREVILCAGARNLDLVKAFLAAPSIRSWRHFEERSAAFFALGRIQAGAGPVAVVVTSGTAVAELLPAAVEARYQGLPLLLLTADRPRTFRGSGAPQTIDQAGLFGTHAPLLADLDSTLESTAPPPSIPPWKRTGPAQINLGFNEPAAEPESANPSAPGPPPLPPSPDFPCPPDWDHFESSDEENLAIAVGALAPEEQPAVANWLACLQAPVWIEPTSGLWGHPDLTPLWVRHAEALFPKATHVLRLGGVPNGRFWRDLESQTHTRVRSLSRTGLPGLARPDAETHRCCLSGLATQTPPPPITSPNWLAKVRAADLQLSRQFPASPPPHARELNFVAAISQIIPTHSHIFLGNSLPIRHWQAAATWKPRFAFYANRGANGIDGEISTFLGCAEGAPDAWAILGDLTALYDLAAPWILPQMHSRKIRICLLNNYGGGIFTHLASMRNASDLVRDTICNPHAVSFKPWAEMWQFHYLEWNDPGNLPQIPDGPTVIECTCSP